MTKIFCSTRLRGKKRENCIKTDVKRPYNFIFYTYKFKSGGSSATLFLGGKMIEMHNILYIPLCNHINLFVCLESKRSKV